MKTRKRFELVNLWVILKGFAMGAANVIPGVSGGTIALVTGIYEDLINALKSFDKKALQLLLKGNIKELSNHINAKFLFALMFGVLLSIFSLAKAFAYLLVEHPTQIWAFFFGLVLASVYYVGKTVESWSVVNRCFFLLGTLIALLISFTNPAPTANGNYLFVFFCGIIGISGMLLPGLSGSYILMLLGNYKLLMVDSINTLSSSLKSILSGDLSFLKNTEHVTTLIHFSIFLLGSVFGLLVFSKVIAWIFQRYKNSTISILTGFVFGSLAIIWPWKNEVRDPNILDRHGNEMIVGYERFIPEQLDKTTLTTLVCMILGVACIWAVEKLAEKQSK
jgi:putative membrane protein